MNKKRVAILGSIFVVLLIAVSCYVFWFIQMNTPNLTVTDEEVIEHFEDGLEIRGNYYTTEKIDISSKEEIEAGLMTIVTLNFTGITDTAVAEVQITMPYYWDREARDMILNIDTMRQLTPTIKPKTGVPQELIMKGVSGAWELEKTIEDLDVGISTAKFNKKIEGAYGRKVESMERVFNFDAVSLQWTMTSEKTDIIDLYWDMEGEIAATDDYGHKLNKKTGKLKIDMYDIDTSHVKVVVSDANTDEIYAEEIFEYDNTLDQILLPMKHPLNKGDKLIVEINPDSIQVRNTAPSVIGKGVTFTWYSKIEVIRHSSIE